MAVKKRRKRKNIPGAMWQRNGDGPLYRSTYLRDHNGERVFVLSRLKKTGDVHNITFESYAMARRSGWEKVS